jgi:hypothetical protein
VLGYRGGRSIPKIEVNFIIIVFLDFVLPCCITSIGVALVVMTCVFHVVILSFGFGGGSGLHCRVLIRRRCARLLGGRFIIIVAAVCQQIFVAGVDRLRPYRSANSSSSKFSGSVMMSAFWLWSKTIR